MATIDACPGNNGRASEAWYRSWTHFRVDRRTPGYCRVTVDHPPVNAITATTVAELAELVELIEHDGDLGVVVFDSANPEFYLGDHDVEDDPSRHAAWADVLGRLAHAPAVGIAAIRGRIGEGGREFVIACDLALVVTDDELEDAVEEIALLLARFDQDAVTSTESYT
jgi:enoyl-CoA hydratase/carnithine racemase